MRRKHGDLQINEQRYQQATTKSCSSHLALSKEVNVKIKNIILILNKNKILPQSLTKVRLFCFCQTTDFQEQTFVLLDIKNIKIFITQHSLKMLYKTKALSKSCDQQ